MAETPRKKTATREIVGGDLRLNNVSFRYGTLDTWVLRETPIYSQPLPTASIVETFLLQAHTT
jgi:hypothetical protein